VRRASELLTPRSVGDDFETVIADYIPFLQRVLPAAS